MMLNKNKDETVCKCAITQSDSHDTANCEHNKNG
jgi:hypothetical protein